MTRVDSCDSGVKQPPAGPEQPVRRLRPRNVQPEYNEDKAFENLIHPGHSVLSASGIANEDGDGSGSRKPDHLVVVYKHSPEAQIETPNRMRLLPAATLNKLQAGLHHLKSGTQDQSGPDPSLFPAETTEPENDCIDQHTFAQYLNLIPTASLNNKKTITDLKQKWPLRLHSRASPIVRSKSSASPRTGQQNSIKSVGGSCGRSLCFDSPAKSEAEKNNMWINSIKSKERFVTSQKTPQNVLQLDPNGVLHLVPSVGSIENNNNNNNKNNNNYIVTTQSQPLKKQTCSNPYPSHDQDLFCVLPYQPSGESMKSEQRKTLLKRFVKKYMLKPAEYYKPGLEMTSPLGKRLLEAYASIVNLQSGADLLRFVKSYERNCSTSLLNRQLVNTARGSLSAKVKIDFALPSPSKTNCMTARLLRSQLAVNPASNAWGLKSYHIYPFSKQERLEKSLTMTSGLDWKARLISLHSDDMRVQVQELTSCDVCHQEFDADVGHSCYTDLPATSCDESAPEPQVFELSDSCDQIPFEADEQPFHQMVLCDEDEEEEEMNTVTVQEEEEEEVILISGPSSFHSVSDSQTSRNVNFESIPRNRSPAEVLIEF